ncbi:MAG TPA: hypothetical protein PLU81_00460 [Deltaproteobacteria bacterium]|nr:hypothetical protein [Deltaproteobacteria bacterium]
MTFKAFFIRSIVLTLSIVVLVVSFNVCMNEYGLFGDVSGKSIKIYGNERTSKYLLSFNYIPANFDGLLIGSSVSDNIDSKEFVGCRFYNASINGTTVAELKILVDNVLAKGDLKCVILSLYPILTESDEKRTTRMVPREYWGSLGSINTLDFYRRKILINMGKMYDYFDEYGRYDYNLRKAGRDSKRLIQKEAERMSPNEPIGINDRAYADLDSLLKAIRASGIKIFAYYHPIPQEYFVMYEQSYRTYKEKLNALFETPDVVWDYNTADFLDFRRDHTNYCDHVHLSRKGIEFITRDINRKLASQL